jgi:hypothetical protein
VLLLLLMMMMWLLLLLLHAQCVHVLPGGHAASLTCKHLSLRSDSTEHAQEQ